MPASAQEAVLCEGLKTVPSMVARASWPMLVQTEIEAGDLVLWPKEAVQRSDMLERDYQVMSSDPVKELVDKMESIIQ